jgi:uncharacterized protein (TIGR00369 family)
MNGNHELTTLYESILKDATNEDLEVLTRLLQSVRDVQTKVEPTYLHAVFKYKGELTGPTSYEATIQLNPFFLNVLNILHGGITATFADSAMGTLVGQLLPKEKASVTSELKINYLRPVRGEMLTCKAEVVHRGKSLWVTESKIYDENNQPVVFASGSFFVIPRK